MDAENDARARQQELEEELEAYTRKGIVSPSFMKAVRWFSRFLWLALSAMLVFSVWDGWGKVPQETYQRAVDSAKNWNERTKAAEKTIEDQAADLIRARMHEEQLKLDAELMQPALADDAGRLAQNIVRRLWGEKAYAIHWRALLARAEPQGHGDDPGAVARALMEQAAKAPATVRFELLRELADLGLAHVGEQARTLLATGGGSQRAVAALVLSRVGLAGDVPLLGRIAQEEKDATVAREIWFAHAALEQQVGASAEVKGVYLAEYWLVHALRGYEARQDALETACREAPPAYRLELTALLAEVCGAEQEPFMRALAVSEQRPGAERILAVRWLGRNRLAPELLKSLSEGDGAVAREAKKVQ